jgi:hypothetical protein
MTDFGKWELFDETNNTCVKFYSPFEHLAVDEESCF